VTEHGTPGSDPRVKLDVREAQENISLRPVEINPPALRGPSPDHTRAYGVGEDGPKPFGPRVLHTFRMTRSGSRTRSPVFRR
jgi:hypothetical protein